MSKEVAQRELGRQDKSARNEGPKKAREVLSPSKARGFVCTADERSKAQIAQPRVRDTRTEAHNLNYGSFLN